MSASDCKSCNGCQHQKEQDGDDWCAMFGTKPDRTPCAQHDMFETERRTVAVLARHNPFIVNLMVAAAKRRL